jgi:hypothetical protein
MVVRSLRMPVAGRSTAGLVALGFAPPMCRLMGITDESAVARRVGAVVAATDFAGVINVLASSTARAQRRAAVVNATLDVVLATGLLGLGIRRHGTHRAAAILASATVWFGAGAWLIGARQLAH